MTCLLPPLPFDTKPGNCS